MEGQAGEAWGRAFSRPCQPQEAGGGVRKMGSREQGPYSRVKEQGRAFWKWGQNKRGSEETSEGDGEVREARTSQERGNRES